MHELDEPRNEDKTEPEVDWGEEATVILTRREIISIFDRVATAEKRFQLIMISAFMAVTDPNPLAEVPLRLHEHDIWLLRSLVSTTERTPEDGLAGITLLRKLCKALLSLNVWPK